MDEQTLYYEMVSCDKVNMITINAKMYESPYTCLVINSGLECYMFSNRPLRIKDLRASAKLGHNRGYRTYYIQVFFEDDIVGVWSLYKDFSREFKMEFHYRKRTKNSDQIIRLNVVPEDKISDNQICRLENLIRGRSNG